MKKADFEWSEKDIEILKSTYPSGGTSQVMLLIHNVNKGQIAYAAKKFNIKYDKSFSYFNKLKPLLDENNFNYYWLGFIMADGCFSLTGNSNLSIHISKKDENHLKIFADFLNVKINYQKGSKFGKYYCSDSCSVSISDSINAPILIERFNLKYKKTENPPKLECLNSKEKFLSFLIGFIDGDGCITKNRNRANMMRIQCHKNWIDNFGFFSNELQKHLNIQPNFYIDNRNFSKFVITDFNSLKKLKVEMLKLNIPYLKRKWDNIDESQDDVFRADDFKDEFLILWKSGKSVKEIAKHFKCSLGPIFRLKKKLNLPKKL